MPDTIDFYREILDNLYDGIFFINTEGSITYWNRGATSLTGYRPEDVLNRNYSELFRPLDRDDSDDGTTGDGVISGVLNESAVSETEAFLLHKEGHLVPITIRIAPVREVECRFVAAVEIFSSHSPRYALRQRIEELQELAMFDTLTGLANRRFLEMSLATRLEELNRYDCPFAVLFIDVDNFKRINDAYSHKTGDRVLKMIGTTMTNGLRSFDVIGRWGGEEFLALLINMKEDDLFPVVDRFRWLVENSVLTLDNGKSLNATVSIGATLARSGETAESLVERADRLMFESKRLGKNRVTTDTGMRQSTPEGS